ncbi:glycosyltransferase family 2 protein [[Eubacterium] cellulosolvens]
MKTKIFAVIPAFNEEGRIEKVIRKIDKKSVDKIIVVDDCSTDKTAKVSRASGAIVISHTRNLGVGAAIKTGYNEALRRGAQILVVIAGDGQHDPKEIPNLIKPILSEKVDYVVGDRLSRNPLKQGMPRFRHFGNSLLTRLTRSLTRLDIKDAQCGFSAITKDALLRINLEFLTNRWGLPNDMLFECAAKGLSVKYVPIKVIYGGRKSYISLPNYVIRVSTILFRGFIRYLYFYHSLYLFSLTGAIFLLVGFLYGLYITYETLTTRNLPGVGSVILDAVLILAGIQLLIFGFLLDMIKLVESRISEQRLIEK